MKLNEFSSGGFAAVAMPMGQMQRRVPKKKKKVDEMDKGSPQPGRDGHVSHSTYGTRDRDDQMIPGPFKLDIALRRHMLKKLAWETDWELSDLELLKDQELADLYHEKVADARDFYNDLKANADQVLGARTLKRTMESIEQENQPAPEPAPQVQERTIPSLFEYVTKKEQEIEQTVKEFAPDNSGESGRWYTDDQLTDIVGDGWWNDLDVSGDIPKQEMVQEAQTWLDDNGYSVHVLNVKVNDDDCEWFIEGSFQNSRFAKKGLGETKQRLDAKCWDGYKKQGTKIKGNTRVNNCVPEAANAAQQAAIAIAKKKKKELNEAPLELNPGEPTNPRIYGTKANSAELNTRRLRALSQLKDMAKRAEDAQQYDSLLMWKSIVANFAELAMNIGEIDHAIRELEKIRRKGGANSRGIPDLS
jgi:hypothetical protein